MNRKFISDISANSLQVIVNQFCGLLIFYILSAGLDKNHFGEINWTLAVLLSSFNILTLGIDQVVIKRIASGSDPGRIFSLYAVHVLLAGVFFYGLLFFVRFAFTDFFLQHRLLLILGIAKLLFFFSTPFKQLAIGLEKFRPLVFMSVSSNIIRSIILIVITLLNRLNLTNVMIIFIAGDMAELMISYFITKYYLKIPLLVRWDKPGYLQIIRESLPQAGVVIFNAAIARFDWILLGILASNIFLAEYSFAYKVFEMATLPLLVIAPILIPRFTKLLHQPKSSNHTGKVYNLLVLLRIEMIIASLSAMTLTICWVPLVDWITIGKYGSVNRYTIAILALSMPLLYLNNFLWTFNFTKGATKMIFQVTLFTFIVNLAADILLIPHFKGEGAAVAFVLAILVQSVLFLKLTTIIEMPQKWHNCLVIPALALVSCLIAANLFHPWWLVLTISYLLFGMLLLITAQADKSSWLVIKRMTGI